MALGLEATTVFGLSLAAVPGGWQPDWNSGKLVGWQLAAGGWQLDLEKDF
jgi:hypothetical protein